MKAKTKSKIKSVPAPAILSDNNKQVSSGMSSGAKAVFQAVGSSGTNIQGGYLNEDYLRPLRGKKGAMVFDEMRRSESQVAMLLKAVMNPIKSALWDFESAPDVKDGDKHRDFIRYNANECIDFDTHKHEALTMIIFGHAVFEIIHSAILKHHKLGTHNGLKALAFRSQKTIEKWNVDKVTGQLISVEQTVQGDTAVNGQNPVMPAENLAIITLDKEGDNYEGISALRPMYGAYFRKNHYLKLAAIGIEKNAIGTPKGTIPKDKVNSKDEIEVFEAILSDLATHESSYITIPEGWIIDLLKSEFDPSKLKEMIILENTEMINSLVANFLALGTNGAGGAFALGTDLSDFFMTGLEQYGKLIAGVWNRKIIPDLIKLNFGPQDAYPKLVITGIKDKAGKELADIIKILIDSKAIRPDMKLEEFLRKSYDLPVADETTVREVPSPVAYKFSDRNRLMLADVKKFIANNKSDVKEVMQSGVSDMLDNYKKQITKLWDDSTEAGRQSIALKLEPKGLTGYTNELKEALAVVANDSLIQAQRETKWIKKKIKMSERFQLSAPQGGYYAALPTQVRRLVADQANLIVQTQANDVLKHVALQYASSYPSTEDLKVILKDITDTIEPVIEGSTAKGLSLDAAAGNSVANVTNQARLSWFFEPEVLETIESFTFLNDDPDSEICKELAGTTFSTDDPNLDRYSPPLHHNCESILVPNQRGGKNNPDVHRGDVSISQKGIDSITLCECHYRLSFKVKTFSKRKN